MRLAVAAALLRRIEVDSLLNLSRAVPDSAHVRADKGGQLTGPGPVDWGKPGSGMHVLSDANGLPLVVGRAGASSRWNRRVHLAFLARVRVLGEGVGITGRRSDGRAAGP